MTEKTKTIPLEIPAHWEFERASVSTVGVIVDARDNRASIRAYLHLPTKWTWCEQVTDEMARLRPRCEVRDFEANMWIQATLVAYDESCAFPVMTSGAPARTWRYCRVRLDEQGKVIVDWKDEA